MKKLLLLALSLSAVGGLTACDSDSKLAAEYSDKLMSMLEGTNYTKEFDTVDEYMTEYASFSTYYAYSFYVGEHLIVPAVVNAFAYSLVDADVTSKQFYSIVDAIEEVLEDTNQEIDLELLFIDTLLDAKLSSDQLINTTFNMFMGLDDKILAAIELSEAKGDYATEHAELVEDIKADLADESAVLLFELTEDDREDALSLGQVSLGDALDYTYALETIYNTLKTEVENATDLSTVITKANVTAIVEANALAFSDSFGERTEKNYQDAMAIYLKLNAELDPSFDVSDYDADEIGTGLFLAKESVGIAFDNLVETDNQDAVYEIVAGLLETITLENYMIYNFFIVGANAVLDVKEILTEEQFAMLGFDETVLNTLANREFLDISTELTQEDEDNVYAFAAVFQNLFSMFF